MVRLLPTSLIPARHAKTFPKTVTQFQNMSYLQCFIKDLPCCSAWHSASGEEGIPTNALVTMWQLAMPVLKSRSQVHRPSRSTPWRKVETWQGIFQSRPLDNAVSLRWRLQLGPHPGGSAGKKEQSDSISDPRLPPHPKPHHYHHPQPASSIFGALCTVSTT